jgi:opacity protein-like surface antigen
MRLWLFAAVVSIAASTVLAEDAIDTAPFGTPIDLTSFQGEADVDLDDLIEPVGLMRGDDGSTRRFYLAPIVGASWGQLLVQESLFENENLFTAGGAAGVAITRPMGQVRIEAEGRYRDGLAGSLGVVDILATDNWSSLANVWRDFGVTESLGVYAGGGIGAGGYRFVYDAAGDEFANFQGTGFAWQIGTGVIYAVSDRVTLDLGYRYYSVGPLVACDCGGLPGEISNQFVSNELLFTVRIYDPFRGAR